MPNKYVSQVLYQTLQTAQVSFENCSANKFSKTTIAILFNLPHEFLSLPPFVFSALFMLFNDVSVKKNLFESIWRIDYVLAFIILW